MTKPITFRELVDREYRQRFGFRLKFTLAKIGEEADVSYGSVDNAYRGRNIKPAQSKKLETWCEKMHKQYKLDRIALIDAPFKTKKTKEHA